ncbi:uncharacterized protein LOC128966116 [Oppia nitens]|uniref:uncharacterized protein LOC128966116 n=1 Tax=Oppia nitens TaxID=1686743 RepID=UPI0023DAB521|nr:uncharacterized protein LOC128966116 [Oppia nitens]
MSDKEVMIDNDYEEEEEEGDQTSQEVQVLPIDSPVSKEEMTSSTAATNEEITSSAANEVKIDENEYLEEENVEEEGEQTSQEVPVLPIDSLVSKDEMTSLTAATNEEITSSATNEEMVTNGYSAEQLNQLYWWAYSPTKKNDNKNNNCIEFQTPIMAPSVVPNYFTPPPMATNGTGPVEKTQNYWPMAGPSSSVSGDNTPSSLISGDNSQPSTSSSSANNNTSDTEKLYSCQLCSQMNYIKDVPQFSQHIEQHLSANGPFKCDICNKYFKYKSICRNHVMSHCLVRQP